MSEETKELIEKNLLMEKIIVTSLKFKTIRSFKIFLLLLVISIFISILNINIERYFYGVSFFIFIIFIHNVIKYLRMRKRYNDTINSPELISMAETHLRMIRKVEEFKNKRGINNV